MRKLLFLCLFFATALFGQGGGQPINIPITANGWKLDEHQSGGGASLYGTNGVYLGYSGFATQDTHVSPAQLQSLNGVAPYIREGSYQLKFSVKNYFDKYPGYYEAQIDFGTQELCSADGWGTGPVATQVTIVCPGPGYIVIDQALPSGGVVQGEYNLVLSFNVPGWQLYFDNVSLTFTPQ